MNEGTQLHARDRYGTGPLRFAIRNDLLGIAEMVIVGIMKGNSQVVDERQ
jgi:hypothetical protein